MKDREKKIKALSLLSSQILAIQLVKAQEERDKLIEGLREVFQMQKSLSTASKTSLYVQTLLSEVGIDV